MKCPHCGSTKIMQVPETAFESFCGECDCQFDIRTCEDYGFSQEEDEVFEMYQQLMAKRSEMRALLFDAVDSLNRWQLDNQLSFLPFALVLKESDGTYREIAK